jgi:hypothetical protein
MHETVVRTHSPPTLYFCVKGTGMPGVRYLGRESYIAGVHMHAPEVFLKHAAECDGMAKFTRDSQSCAAWKGMAERWRQCAERARREESIVRPARQSRGSVSAPA